MEKMSYNLYYISPKSMNNKYFVYQIRKRKANDRTRKTSIIKRIIYDIQNNSFKEQIMHHKASVPSDNIYNML